MKKLAARAKKRRTKKEEPMSKQKTTTKMRKHIYKVSVRALFVFYFTRYILLFLFFFIYTAIYIFGECFMLRILFNSFETYVFTGRSRMCVCVC